MCNAEIEVLLPVHNEAESIEATIREIYDELSSRLKIDFIVCEDGSSDNTKEILRNLAHALPLRLNLSDARKGYSRAVREGMQMLGADYLLCLDSDGQCDPKDFWKFWEQRESSDVLIGWRVSRSDTFLRKAMSRTFFRVYQFIYSVPVHDPSCPFVLARRDVIERLGPELGEMREGFWWEFVARASRRHFRIREFPVNHRRRLAGQTRVYHLAKLPGIARRHFLALYKIWRQTSS